MSSVAVYAGDEILQRALPWFYWGSKGSDLLSWMEALFQGVFGEGPACNIARALADVLFWMAAAGLMHRKSWYIKI